VIICSYNGAQGIRRCLAALNRQAGPHRFEIIVVDDGSADDTATVAADLGAVVVRHPVNRGLSAARNTGVAHAGAEIIAFLDDDCEPEPGWATALLARFAAGFAAGRPLGVGGAVVPAPMPGVMAGFLTRNNPLRPLDLALQSDERPLYRLGQYLRAQWSRSRFDTVRAVYSLPGAGMSFWKQDLLAIGGSDERIRFAGEDSDLCRRLAGHFPDRPLVFDPAVQVAHHFEPDLADTLRRSRSYARGAALMCRKWPTMRPIVFPIPLLFLGLLATGIRFPVAVAAAVVLPYLGYGSWLADLRRAKDPRCLLDPLIKLAQEAAANIGFLEGAWKHRNFPREQGTVAVGRYAETGHRSTDPVDAA